VYKAIRVAAIVVLDVIFINAAFLMALLLHTEGDYAYTIAYAQGYLEIGIGITLIKIFVYYAFSLYNSIWEYASVEELIKVAGAVTLSSFISAVYILAILDGFYYGIFIIAYVFELLLIGGNRFSYRVIRRLKHSKSILQQEDTKRILVIGSGSTASLIAREIKTHPKRYGRLIGFIDDDQAKKGSYIGGVKVLGNRNDIINICARCKIQEIILAIPTATGKQTKEILDICKLTNSKVTIVPGIVEIIDGKVSLQKIRPVEIEDLLGRNIVDLNIEEIAGYIDAKTIMVTGGGGSIGSELCRHLVKFNPAKLLIVDIYENNLYELQMELSAKTNTEAEIVPLIASTREKGAIFKLVEEHKPDVIFHAAAHKHVPLMESSPKEAVKNNVFGTLFVAEAAHYFNVKHFVLISTDKAVNPCSVMGATKRLCEMIIQSLARISKTKFVAVRFGNVLGSNGSVIPLFERQIREGGPVTVTHKDVIRYFMTISEAAQLVIQAGAIAKGGEIFVLDMGEQVRIYDLALDLIKLSGLKPYEDIDIKFTGLRPGEKLYEELLTEDEVFTRTAHNKIYVGSPAQVDFKMLKRKLHILEKELTGCVNDDVRNLLRGLVPTYIINGDNNAAGSSQHVLRQFKM
jgi:FlaA1/EpsC-like NDP-sugar epimerase